MMPQIGGDFVDMLLLLNDQLVAIKANYLILAL